MKLLIDAYTLEGGGITHLENLLKTKYLSNFEIVVVARRHHMKRILSARQNISFIDGLKYSFVNYYLFIIHSVIRSHDIDLVFSTNGFYIGAKKSVIICHNILPFDPVNSRKYYSFKKQIKFLLMRIWFGISYARAKHVIFLSNFAAKTVCRYVKVESKTIIPHGLQHIRIQSNGVIQNDQITNSLVYTSSFEPYKNHDILLLALANLRDRGIKLRLNLIGTGENKYTERIKKLIIDLSLVDAVKLWGQVAQKDLSKIYADCDTALFLSECENLPNILLEYMHVKLPVICANVGPMKEIMATNPDWCVSHMDVASIEDILLARLENKLAGFKFFTNEERDYYDWSSVAEKHDAIFRSVVM